MQCPTSKELYDFLARWKKAQRESNIEAMEEMLQLSHMNNWWHLFTDVPLHEQDKNDIIGCIERTLIKSRLVADSSERPSERAMRLSHP
jgi:hypothetical protein